MNPFKQAPIMRQAIIGVIKRTGNQALQVLGFSGELVDDVPLYQQAGFASWLPKDAEVVMLPMSGKARNFVIVAGRDAVAIELQEGETVVYNQHGVELRLSKDKIKSNASLEVDGDITSTGEVSDKLGSMTQMRTVYNTHGHGNMGASPPTSIMGAANDEI